MINSTCRLNKLMLMDVNYKHKNGTYIIKVKSIC